MATFFDELADRLIDDTWKPNLDVIPEHVYHYTTALGLEGILRSQQVWATDSRFLNDMSESSIGIAVAKELVRSRYYQEKDTTRRRFYRRLRDVLKEEWGESNFVFSMSERADDLTQWRTYANEGEGFTIGFCTKSIVEASNSDNKFSFNQVSYNSATHHTRIKRAIDEFEKEYHLNNDGSGDSLEDCCVNLDSVISSYSAGYKHSSFRSEREWRISCYPNEGRDDVKVRVSRQRIVPYIPISLGKDQNPGPPIKTIGIGPGFRGTAVQYAVERLCAQYDIEVDVYNADTPFRRIN